jgi:alcohol dehydrogenase/L-iditol 2-dehydrogenase
VAYQALVVLSDIKPGRAVLVMGPGPIGLFCVQVARAAGAVPIVTAGTGKDTARLNTAKELGAHQVINVSSQEALEKVLEITGGQGFPVVADAAGNSRSLKLAIDAVARGGQVTKIGWGPKPVDFSLDPLLAKAARLQGTFSHNRPTWEAVLRMIADGSIRMEPMISRRIKLEKWEETFEAIERCEIIKAVMTFNND